ncbi:MAG: hypothetical protein GXY83_08835 [Rhodopirellula sp.]|nr:hypothetical protein [Rhodopirellula sp.]
MIMGRLGRILLLGVFAALGVGLAIAVGLSQSPPARLSDSEIALAVKQPAESNPPAGRSGIPSETVCQTVLPGCDGNSIPASRQDDEGPGSETSELPQRRNSISALIPVEPHALQAAEANAGGADERIQKALEYLQQRLQPQQGAGEPEALPAPTPQPAPIPKTDLRNPAGAARNRIRRSFDGEGDEHLSIHIQDSDLREVLEMLGEQGGLNILAGNSVQGKVSASLNDVDIDGALGAILRSTGYSARREGKFIYVGTPEDFDAMAKTLDVVGTRVYRPNYLTATDLQTLITPLLTPTTGVCSISAPAEIGIGTDDDLVGGNGFAGIDVVLVRDYEAVLAQVDQVVNEVDIRPMQVAIEAMILSVRLADTDKFGVNFELLRDEPDTKFGWGMPLASLADLKFTDGGLKFGFLDKSLGAFLDALETIGDTNVIATPRVLVLNKHRADILIGKEEGYVSTTQTETARTQSIEFLDIGAQLRLRPFISPDGLIRMEVHPELSDGNVRELAGFTVPRKDVTKVTTNIMVRDGCTVVIGGLMRNQLETTTRQVPFFGSLPVVGVAFRNVDEKISREEVIVLITPRIVYEPQTCCEGERQAFEFTRRQDIYADQMSIAGKRSIGRRYARMAEQAWQAGDTARAMRFADLSVHFDPLNRESIELRSQIAAAEMGGGRVIRDPSIAGPAALPPHTETFIAPEAPAVLEGQPNAPLPPTTPLHPRDPGIPGTHRDIIRPGSLQ